MSLLIGGVVTEHTRNCSDDRSTYKFSLLQSRLGRHNEDGIELYIPMVVGPNYSNHD